MAFFRNFSALAQQASDDAVVSEIEKADVALILDQSSLYLKLGGANFKMLKKHPRFSVIFNRIYNSSVILKFMMYSGECSGASSKGVVEGQNCWKTACEALCGILSLRPEHEHCDFELRLAVAVSLAHSSPVPAHADYHPLPVTNIDPVARYLYLLESAPNMFEGFTDLGVFQLRLIAASPAESQELDWCRLYDARNHPRYETEREALCPKSPQNIHRFAHIVPYCNRNNHGSVHQPAIFYQGQRRTVQILSSIGGVCGAVGHMGATMANACGAPGLPVCQPGHCAFINRQSAGRWILDNDVVGWERSTLSSEFTCKPWSFSRLATTVPLMDMAQEDSHSYIRSERLSFLGVRFLQDTQKDYFSLQLAERLFNIATRECPYNLACWINRIDVVASRTRSNTLADSEHVMALISAISSSFSYEHLELRNDLRRILKSSRNFLQLQLSQRVKLAEFRIDKQLLINEDFDAESLLTAGYHVEAWMSGTSIMSGSGQGRGGRIIDDGAGVVVRSENVRHSQCGSRQFYMIEDYQYTKVIEWPSQQSRYYEGRSAQFDESRWQSYTISARPYILNLDTAPVVPTVAAAAAASALHTIP
jgi:hypothetical protein